VKIASKASDVPGLFSSFSHRLTLLFSASGFIAIQAEANRLPDDVTKALQGIILI